MSRLDVVVFGATGFTGQHVAEQLARAAARRSLAWAVAGRSREKLLGLLKRISDKTGEDLSTTKVLIGDVHDEGSMQEVCAQAKVLVNCCGPYNLYGEVVVKAAVHSRTHYVDVSGEPYFIETMQLKYDRAARAAGVYVVSACAFESIPADLGVLFLQQHFGGVLNSVECYVTSETSSSSINYGTWHSLINGLTHDSDLRALRGKVNTAPHPERTPKLQSRSLFHKRLNGWCIRFPSYDSSSVYSTQRYFYEKEGTRPAQFKCYIAFKSFFAALLATIAFIVIYAMSRFKITREILLKNPKIFSLGMVTDTPSETAVQNTSFEVTLFGKGWDQSDASSLDTLPPNKSVTAKITGKNPGYGMTVMGVLYSAVAILEEQHNMPPGGGVLTPGIAFAKTKLIKNLQENGVTFQIVDSKDHQD